MLSIVLVGVVANRTQSRVISRVRYYEYSFLSILCLTMKVSLVMIATQSRSPLKPAGHYPRLRLEKGNLRVVLGLGPGIFN